MNCSCDTSFLHRYVVFAVGLASDAKASLLLINGSVRYSEYFLREQEVTLLAIAALRLCKAPPVRLGAVAFGFWGGMMIKSWQDDRTKKCQRLCLRQLP
jgi:hypothetical protein